MSSMVVSVLARLALVVVGPLWQALPARPGGFVGLASSALAWLASGYGLWCAGAGLLALLLLPFSEGRSPWAGRARRMRGRCLRAAGLAVALGTLSAPLAAAATPSAWAAPMSHPAASADSPTDERLDPQAKQESPTPAWTAPRVAPELPRGLGGGGAAQHHVVVAQGDSLWAIAARHLGPGASEQDIAEEWPRWYKSNRDAIGSDPNLLTIGARLIPPE